MNKLPQAIIIVDPKKEINAIREARKLNIPVFGLVDTNCDPDDVDFVIPANDDAVRAVKVVIGVLNNAICESRNLEMIDYVTEEDKNKKEEITSKEEKKAEVKEDIIEEKKKEPVKEEVVKQEEKDYSSMTLTELKAVAKEQGVKGYSTMKKDELISNLK